MELSFPLFLLQHSAVAFADKFYESQNKIRKGLSETHFWEKIQIQISKQISRDCVFFGQKVGFTQIWYNKFSLCSSTNHKITDY